MAACWFPPQELVLWSLELSALEGLESASKWSAGQRAGNAFAAASCCWGIQEISYHCTCMRDLLILLINSLIYSRVVVITKLEYTKPLRIVEYPHPCLRAENSRIGFPAQGLKELAQDMFRIMYRWLRNWLWIATQLESSISKVELWIDAWWLLHLQFCEPYFCSHSDDGVGLAAPQVGVNARLMVFNPSPEGDRGQELVMVNPIITAKGGKEEALEEGCLSFRAASTRELLLGDVKVCHVDH